MSIAVQKIGLLAPGLPDWHSALPVLRGEADYVAGDMPKFVPEILPATERRRCAESAKLAIHVAWETLKDSGVDPAAVASVFASSSGGSDISRRICLSLTGPEPFVSPTLFHNSVHNAAAGYWSIAAKSMQSSNSLSAWDWSAAAGLQAAFAQVLGDQVPVLLVVFDQPALEPIYATRPLVAPFATALLLTPEPRADSIATLSLASGNDATELSVCGDPALERLRRGNPAARMLPLLAALAGDGSRKRILEAAQGVPLVVDIEQCN